MNNPPSSAFVGTPARDVALDSLRAFITLLVIALHAVMAYHPYAPPPGEFSGANMIWGAFPVVDAVRAKGVDLFVTWNDSFFMALMFLLSGLFVGPSLLRKGTGRFVRDRFIRLGVPFVVGALVLAPLAYYPAYLQRAAATSAGGFWDAWLALGSWPAGPMWFLWVLLAFGCVAAAVHRLAPGALQKLAAFGAWCNERPVASCLGLLAAATIGFVAAGQVVSPFAWFAWGPFTVQTARVPLYAAYFFFGVALGVRGGLTDGLLARTGGLARRWIIWQVVAGVVFIAFVAALITALMNLGRGVQSPLVDLLANGLYAATGVTTSFSLLAFFARWCGRGHAVFASLSRNAFAMYVIHYGIVTWLQYGLLGVTLPGLVKAVIVILAAILLSWAGAAIVRRIPVVSRVL